MSGEISPEHFTRLVEEIYREGASPEYVIGRCPYCQAVFEFELGKVLQGHMPSQCQRKVWTQEEAIKMARNIEEVARLVGAHIGLTGGCLYKDGPRKDLDIVVYRVRQLVFDRDRFFDLLRAIGIVRLEDHGFVAKATYGPRDIDFLFPEEDDGGYPC